MEPHHPRHGCGDEPETGERPAELKGEVGSSLPRGEGEREEPEHQHDREEGVAEPDGWADREPGSERLRVDPSDLVREAPDEVVVALDQPHETPETQPAKVRVPGLHGRLDPVQLGADAGGRGSLSLHGPLRVRGYDAPDGAPTLRSSASLGRRAPSPEVPRSRRLRTPGARPSSPSTAVTTSSNG